MLSICLNFCKEFGLVCLTWLKQSAISGQLTAFSNKVNIILMRDFKSLLVWQKSHELTLSVYELTSDFPRSEIYGLTSQIRRSSSSIPTNIAEGCGRTSQSQMAHFLNISLGSASELRYQIILARDLNYISNKMCKELSVSVDEVMKMLTSLHQQVQRTNS